MIAVTVERLIPAPPEELYKWMSDYSSHDYTGPNWSAKEGVRRSLLEQDDGHAVFTDYYGKSELTYRAEKTPPTRIEAEGHGGNLDGHVITRIDPAPGGAKLTVLFEFSPKGISKFFAGLMQGQVKRSTIRQVDLFIRDFNASRPSNRQ